MTVRLQIERMQPGNAGEANEYIRLAGTAESGARIVAVCFGPVAKALRLSLVELAGKDEFVDEIIERGVAIKLDGAFVAAEREVDGRRFRQTQFKASKFEILTGPSIELFRLRKNGAALLADSTALAKAGDVQGAYLKLEQFVARIAGVDPLALVDELAVEDTPAAVPNPELAAARRLLPEQEVATLAPDASAAAPAEILSHDHDTEAAMPQDPQNPAPDAPTAEEATLNEPISDASGATPAVDAQTTSLSPDDALPAQDIDTVDPVEMVTEPAPVVTEPAPPSEENATLPDKPTVTSPPPPVRRRPLVAGIPLAPPSGLRRTPNLPRPAPRPSPPPAPATEEQEPPRPPAPRP